MFIHYGLYSLLGSGEWVLNRERISPVMYNCGGMRVAKVPHTPYDPQPSDIQM